MKPGHRGFITVWLVDPHIRIISTTNGPLEQQDWWVESIFGRSAESQKTSLEDLSAEPTQLLRGKELIGKSQLGHTTPAKLPVELLDIVRTHLEELPGMGVEAARDHRLKLVSGRNSFDTRSLLEWQCGMYTFCEH
ncbi:hypothetical protein ANO14919_028930 [Xylariales sp. No.14919]|nr:hypothetical protein ANO14919_028930 [Xylariales sp. No.14919]